MSPKLIDLEPLINKVKKFWTEFSFIINAVIVLFVMALYFSVIKSINDVMKDKPLYVQFVVWTALGFGSFAVIGYLIYKKGKKDGSVESRVQLKELQLTLEQIHEADKKIHKQMEEYETQLQDKDSHVESLKKKIIKKDNAIHDLKDVFGKVKNEEAKKELLKKLDEVVEFAEVAKDRIPEVPGQVAQTIRKLPGEFMNQSKQLMDKAQGILKNIEAIKKTKKK